MLSYLRYRLAVLRLARVEGRQTRDFRRAFARVTLLPTEAERAAEVKVLAERDLAAQTEMEVARLGAMTRYLTSRGNRLLLPYPPTDDQRYWRTRPDHSLYLTREGVVLYREQIEAHEIRLREAR